MTLADLISIAVLLFAIIVMVTAGAGHIGFQLELDNLVATMKALVTGTITR